VVIRTVLVAFDFSALSEAALGYGRALARTFGARLHLLYVMENDFFRPTAGDPEVLAVGAQQQLANKLVDQDWHELDARTVVVRSDDAAAEIVQYAQREQVDLIVMGTHGHVGLAHVLLGSVAEHVVRTAPCPVLTTRHVDQEPSRWPAQETGAAAR
jgi:nucleotide-binding universal stress UspA family protein